MRKSIEKKTEVNLLIPIDPAAVVVDSDCFGKEWESRASECNICSDCELCQIVYTEQVKSKKLTFEVMNGPLLDQSDFQSVDMAKIERLAKKYQDEGDPMSFQELQDVIASQANTKDNEAVIQFIKRELPLTKIYLQEGVCRVR
jgi:uncharacterized Fe-S cluster-containing radical SAM superfamily enzyme